MRSSDLSLLSGSFGGINLEDIAAPRCFEIERKLKELCDIPIFHDDQHGTAVVVLAALTNALKVVGKKIEDITLVTSGAGAAGVAIVKLLMAKGLKNVILCNSKGAIYEGKPGLSPGPGGDGQDHQPGHVQGTLADALVGGRRVPGGQRPRGWSPATWCAPWPRTPFCSPWPTPPRRSCPTRAKAAGAAVMGTGRSDFPNQINNVAAFPGIFRGALDVRASDINDEMKIAAAEALAGLVSDQELNADYIMPYAFDERICPAVGHGGGGGRPEVRGGPGLSRHGKFNLI